MSTTRPTVLSIAGFDPSAGAGVLADIKTFESFNTYGISVITANTIQHDEIFEECLWVDDQTIYNQLEFLLERFKVEIVKIGIIRSSAVLYLLLNKLYKYNPNIKIVYDPVMSSSTGYQFQKIDDRSLLYSQLKKVFLITPNWNEITEITGEKDGHEAGILLSEYCSVLLKGGHHPEKKGHDYLYKKGKLVKVFIPSISTNHNGKHGSGCVLSSAIAANLALDFSIIEAISIAKSYMTKFLNSNNSQLGYHKY